MTRACRIRRDAARTARGVAFLLVAGSGIRAAQTQEPREERPLVDPYSEGDPEVLAALGYEHLGDFAWSQDLTTNMVAESLGGVPFLWVETRHFRLGSSLEPAPIPDDPDQKKRVRAELDTLRERMPGIKRRVRELDPWLRLHLYALRLEQAYADFVTAFALEDVVFPAADGSLGPGPYLGMKEKPRVVLVEKDSTLARYTQVYLGIQAESSFRWFDVDEGAAFLGFTVDNLKNTSDGKFHHAVVYCLEEHLVNCFAGYSHRAPVWFSNGVGRWFARKLDWRELTFTTPPGVEYRTSLEDARWEPKVRARVEHEYFPTMEELFAWDDVDKVDFTGHMMAWSRVDFLMSLGPEVARDFLLRARKPIPWMAEEQRKQVAFDQQVEAFQAATGMGLAEFDQAWAAWVEDEYPKK